MIELNKIQEAALNIIQADARYLYTIIDIYQHAPNVQSNYTCMSLPYIGLFVDGAEQWCKKVGMNAPTFTPEEKAYYEQIRAGHKLFSKSYLDFERDLHYRFLESDRHFYNIRSVREKIFGYYNVGADVYNGQFCGNTILCAAYNPPVAIDNPDGEWIKEKSIIGGELASYLCCQNFSPYEYDKNAIVSYKDFHFFKDCPIKQNSFDHFIYFSILCTVNFVTEFVENFFQEEMIQKFKFAYLQYYYLCGFIDQVNYSKGMTFEINNTYRHRSFRNCLAHYGLGQFMSENDIIDNDILKGLTVKAFNKDYYEMKHLVFSELKKLVIQIENIIF